MRGQAKNYDHWKSEGNIGGWDDVLPYFKKSEDHFKGARQAFMVRVALGRLKSKDSLGKSGLFTDMCNQVFRQPRILIAAQILVRYFEVNQLKGVRVSANSAF